MTNIWKHTVNKNIKCWNSINSTIWDGKKMSNLEILELGMNHFGNITKETFQYLPAARNISLSRVTKNFSIGYTVCFQMLITFLRFEYFLPYIFVSKN